jgi:uncharacterized phiE125 gp8 family phage protein
MPETKFQAELVTPPTTEPVTLSSIKASLGIAQSDSTHDERLAELIRQARDQWESDTDSVTCFTSFRLRTGYIHDGLRLPKSPINAITSITYFDGNNTQQTLSSSLYELHVNEIRYAYQVTLPAYADRWDAWTINYRCGYSQDGNLVPAVAKHAIRLLASYSFENPDMLLADGLQLMRNYKDLVNKFQRSTYP